MSVTATDVAKYFLSQMSEDCGDTISNLKLQKLLYYAQGYYLAMHDAPLYSDRIKAWRHGPVIPTVYHEYKEFGDGAIPKPSSFGFSKFNKRQRELMDEVWNVLGQFSAWKLRNMTHEEPPWKDTASNAVISHAALKSYFKTMIK